MTQLATFKQLIITRPERQGDSLFQTFLNQIKQVNIQCLPLIQARPLKFSAPSQELDAAIFVSVNAVNYFYQKAQLEKATLFAVGDKTAARLEQLSGRSVIHPQQMNSEGLLALPQLTEVATQHWLVVKGYGGRTALQEQLTQRGAKVSSLDVYQRKLPTLEQQQQIIKAQSKQTVWVITSAEALTNLHRILGLMNKPAHHTSVIISSERLALLARQKGFTIIAQSAGASEKQLVQCVKSLIE